MLVFRSFEIGQLAFASLAHSSNFSFVIPATFAFRIRCELVITPLSSVISHFVSIASGVNPAAPKTKLNFILKQPACAAAISSSGLVPTPSSKRVLYEYCD